MPVMHYSPPLQDLFPQVQATAAPTTVAPIRLAQVVMAASFNWPATQYLPFVILTEPPHRHLRGDDGVPAPHAVAATAAPLLSH